MRLTTSGSAHKALGSPWAREDKGQRADRRSTYSYQSRFPPTTCTDPGTGTVVNYFYDAWNRLVRIEHETGMSSRVVAEYEYNALGYRIIKRAIADLTGEETSPDTQRMYYYSIGWQLIEERIDDDWSEESSTADRVIQSIWGIRYIDDIVARRADNNADDDFEDEGDTCYWHLTDPQFSTVAVIDESANILERNSYDAFGRARHHRWRDIDGDGDYDSADRTIVVNLAFGANNLIGQSAYRSEADLDRDGDVDTADLAIANTSYDSALAPGELSDPAIDNIVGWSGYQYDIESDLYHVRHRYYDTILMRWINRDPAGYVDSMNLYGYGSGNPLVGADPFGLGFSDGFKAIGRGVFRAYIEAYAYLYSTVVPAVDSALLAIGDNPFHTFVAEYLIAPLLGTSFLANTDPAVLYAGGVLVSVILGITIWFAAPSATVIVIKAHPIHVLYGVGGRLVSASMTGRILGHPKFPAAAIVLLRFQVPVLFAGRVTRLGTAWNCVTAAWHGIMRGWFYHELIGYGIIGYLIYEWLFGGEDSDPSSSSPATSSPGHFGQPLTCPSGSEWPGRPRAGINSGMP